MAERRNKHTELVPVDPLRRYLQEVSAMPMLTPEEEHDLARRFIDKGDLDAAKKLVTTHLRLVAKIAMEYRNSHHNVFDLIQEGNIGLLQAVKHFDPEKGARLAHYATWWIKSYILKYIIDNFRLVKLGTTKEQKKLFYNLMREKEQIESMGFIATPVELAKRLGVDEAAVEDMHKRLTMPEYALEAPLKSSDDGSGGALQDVVATDEVPLDERLADAEAHDILKEKLAEFSQGLTDRDRKILQERLLAELPLTLQEIADEFGISKERVRQLEDRLMDRLRTFFKASGIDAGSIQTGL